PLRRRRRLSRRRVSPCKPVEDAGRNSSVSTPRRRAAAAALAVTLALQMFTSLAATATSVLAPMIASDLDLSPKLIGVFVGIIYVGSMAGSLAAGGFVERFGAIRVSRSEEHTSELQSRSDL